MLKLLIIILLISFNYSIQALSKDDLLVVAVATNKTDEYQRFIRSLNVYGFKYEIYNRDQTPSTDDGQWMKILRENLVRYKDDKTKVLLVTDAYNAIFSQGPEFVLDKFEALKPARIVFGAEDVCWPDEQLKYDYPLVKGNEKRFLNADSFMGYASDIYEMISSQDEIKDEQLFFTKLFLDETTRNKWSIVIDKGAEIFMNLNDAIDELELPVNGDEVYVHNIWTNSTPTVIQGYGSGKKSLNYLSNYIARTWSPTTGCLQSKENVVDVTQIDDLTKWPIVYIALFIEYPTPFLREYFEKIMKITYPKQRMGVLVHNHVEYHKNITEQYLKKFKQDEYKFVKYLNVNDDMTEGEARQQAIHECQEDKCDYLFVIDSIVHIDHPDTLIALININRTVVAPMLLRPGQTWSNFWGDYSDEGFYLRSPDYMDFVNYNKMGLFNVPHIAHAYLINGTFLQHFTPKYIDSAIDPDVKVCQSIRDAGYFMFINNEMNYGHLIDPENFNISLTQPELYEIFNNVKDWKARYLHPDYQKSLEPNATIEQPCTDVYWFPFLSEEFTESFINIMETYNIWSGALHQDVRLAGGYENVPTDDIHMTQVDFQEHWLFILRDIVQPIQQKVFTGYFSDPPKAVLNFVVRYMPDRQKSLRAHHDASTYTINLALNDVGKDYEGGGCRFVRQNCSVLSTRRGWALMQPGRLTHLHEGLPVTKGTRYIMYTNSIDLNIGFTDALTLEEYEDDVELIKLRFDSTRPCRFFSDDRYPKVEEGLANCSWYEKDACCKRTEVASVFESMYTLHQASTQCRNMMNYLMCFFCAPDQYLWYIKKRVKICETFCNEFYQHCKTAEFSGNTIGTLYKSGLQFCEANNFNVVTNDCFAFDASVFSSASYLFQSTIFIFNLVKLCLVIIFVFTVVNYF
ncbi:unnamed protein product [Adineta steineri]|uniref:procollagen-lysine 5-dioxygenase n=1 Tax=Adineta steineri TaxID=433720 RepID=A0A818N2E0_9BILA|nr:unnamed protein product [Adineta steineri]